MQAPYATNEPECVPSVPDGFRYIPNALTSEEESKLRTDCAAIPDWFDTAGRSASFSGRLACYGFPFAKPGWRVKPSGPFPPWLLDCRLACGRLTGIPIRQTEQALVTDYTPGACLSAHFDARVFEEHVIAVSLGADSVVEFTRNGMDRIHVPIAARSIYILAGSARFDWKHAILPLRQQRISITFRSIHPLALALEDR